jgi:hypothetical protein
MMMRWWASVATTTTLLLTVASAQAGPVSGIVTTRTAPGASPAPGIVYAEPLDSAAPRRPGRYTLAQRNRTFLPLVLAVSVGSTVEFPNRDPIFHNVFSLSAPQPFDLGLYRGGASKSVTFTQPGMYRVFCNIHPEMIAFIAVVPTPWLTQVDAQGRYSLDLPPGRYRLTALSDRAQPTWDELAVAAGATIAPKLELDESNFVLLAHKDKYGHDYPRPAYEPAKK